MPEYTNGFYVDDFHCDENMMHGWWDRLEQLPIPTPETIVFPLSDDRPDFEAMVAAMEERGWNHAFLRSDNFSDKVNPRTGSRIAEPTVSEVRRTFETLQNHQMNHMEVPLGEYVAMREWIDLDYCTDRTCREWHPTEVRFFIEDGDLDYATPSVTSLRMVNEARDCTYDYVAEQLRNDVPPLAKHVQTVAEEFTEYAWHVDFALTTNMEWYCIDMGVNGVYWDNENQEWTPMCGHEEVKEELMKKKANRVLPNGPIIATEESEDAV
jgi:hypothetical protein